MKKIIIIRGPLGVGKTTVAKILSRNLNADYLSLDQILKENNLESVDGIPLKNFLTANEIICNLVNNSEKSFIIDGCFYYQEQIDDLVNKFTNDIEIITLLSDVEKCIERDSTRYVHMITTKIKVGHEINNTDLTAEETVGMMIHFLSEKV